jgi:nitroreductase
VFNDNKDAITLLQSRRSAKARNLEAPGPNEDELKTILEVGMRVPDHGKLAPWRFIVVKEDAQKVLGDAAAATYLKEKPEATHLELEAIRNFPQQAPVLIVVLSRLNTQRAIPEWEQRLSAGAACQNILTAAHALGYLGNWLTGWSAYSEDVVRVLGGEKGDKVAGFLFIGSSDANLSERPRPEFDEIVSFYSPK